MFSWDKVHISDEDIANDDSHLWIEQELARVSKEARQQLDDKDIMFIFPSLMSNTHTNLVLDRIQYQKGMDTKNGCLHPAGVETDSGSVQGIFRPGVL